MMYELCRLFKALRKQPEPKNGKEASTHAGNGYIYSFQRYQIGFEKWNGLLQLERNGIGASEEAPEWKSNTLSPGTL